MRRWLTVVPVLLAALAASSGCGSSGGGGAAGPALEETAKKLETIESGNITVAVQITPKDGEAFGYELDGPIKLAGEGEVPLADVEYTQRANGQEETVRLVLTEDGGWVERNGKRTELTQTQVDELRASGSLLGQDGLSSLRFEDWIDDPKLSDGPDGTQKVTGKLDVLSAMTGLASLSGLLEGTKTLSADDRRRVAERIDDSSFELLTGEDDRLLRRLAVGFSFDEEVPADLRDALGENTVGADFSFELDLDRINEPVEIGG